jgi:hypothetical protein
MIIEKLDIWHLKCKFQYPFKHKLATHSGSDNLVVRVTTSQGISGYGEGIPRDFVTGESLQTSFNFLSDNPRRALLQFPAISPANFSPRCLSSRKSFKWKPVPEPSARWRPHCLTRPAAPGISLWPVSRLPAGGQGHLQRSGAPCRLTKNISVFSTY